MARHRRHTEGNDLRDWYVIGAVALLSALVVWLPLLGRF
jgi:energy-coupling factor transporter transmembrane protein EcfT